MLLIITLIKEVLFPSQSRPFFLLLDELKTKSLQTDGRTDGHTLWRDTRTHLKTVESDHFLNLVSNFDQ